MLTIIIIITGISLGVLVLGFYNVRLPFVTYHLRLFNYHSKSGVRKRRAVRMEKRAILYRHSHAGFIKLPTAS